VPYLVDLTLAVINMMIKVSVLLTSLHHLEGQPYVSQLMPEGLLKQTPLHTKVPKITTAMPSASLVPDYAKHSTGKLVKGRQCKIFMLSF